PVGQLVDALALVVVVPENGEDRDVDRAELPRDDRGLLRPAVGRQVAAEDEDVGLAVHAGDEFREALWRPGVEVQVADGRDSDLSLAGHLSRLAPSAGPTLPHPGSRGSPGAHASR